jgi:hypothetical protein
MHRRCVSHDTTGERGRTAVHHSARMASRDWRTVISQAPPLRPNVNENLIPN